jgi:hypothetical protein
MKKIGLLAFLTIPNLVSQPCWSQGIMEGFGVRASSAGLGAGAAASMNHGQAIVRSADTLARAQQAALAQTKAIELSMKLGCDAELKKDWFNAEKYFNYVLKVVALRDGPGSPKSVPALQHLVTVSKGEKNIDQAISYQKTVLAFTKASQAPDSSPVFNEQSNLSNLYVEKEDYWSAEPILRDSVALLNTNPSISADKRLKTLTAYAKVLRKVSKDAEADEVEKALAPQQNPTEVKASTEDHKVDPAAESKTEPASPETIQQSTEQH